MTCHMTFPVIQLCTFGQFLEFRAKYLMKNHSFFVFTFNLTNIQHIELILNWKWPFLPFYMLLTVCLNKFEPFSSHRVHNSFTNVPRDRPIYWLTSSSRLITPHSTTTFREGVNLLRMHMREHSCPLLHVSFFLW